MLEEPSANSPSFSEDDVHWGQAVPFTGAYSSVDRVCALPVSDAQRVFDVALERAKKEGARVPDAEKYIQHVHDSLRWDDLYRLGGGELR